MMAAYLFHFNPLCKKFLGNTFSQTIVPVRNAAKKTGTTRPRKSQNSKPGRHGVKVTNGQIVKAGTILAHQRSILFCPGLNVGVGFIADLYAKVAGKVVFTCEKPNLDEDNWLVQTLYPNYLPKFKKYISVIPKPKHKKFKLVETF